MSTRVLRTPLVALLICIYYLLAVNAFAQEEPPSESEAVDPITAAEQLLVLGEGGTDDLSSVPGVSVFSILRMVLTLAAVALAIYGVVYLLKRISRPRVADDPFLKTLASVPLGVNRSIHVVSVGSKAWLVGSAENGVNLIGEIDDQAILDAMLLEDSKKTAQMPAGQLGDFKTFLRRLGVPSESETPGPESIRKQSERLKGL